MRFFRTNSSAAYEQARATLDAAWGFPSADGATLTCIEPAATAPRDSESRILLAVNTEFCQYDPAADLLAGLLASNAAEEIDAATYAATIVQRIK